MNVSAEMIIATGALVSAILAIAGFIYLAGFKFATLEVKVNTLWEFQMRRAAAETVQKGLGTMSSPLVISEEAKSWLDPIATELKAHYLKHGSKNTELDLMIWIERTYGSWLMDHVCIPHGLHQGACLVIALAVANSGQVVIAESEVT